MIKKSKINCKTLKVLHKDVNKTSLKIDRDNKKENDKSKFRPRQYKPRERLNN